ncbi:MAG: trimethylamine methyltransferase family protein [Kiloniellales bacterium]
MAGDGRAPALGLRDGNDMGRTMVRRSSAGRHRRRGDDSLAQLPWRQLRNPYQPIQVLDDEGIEAIHDASMRILEDHGLEFLSDEALQVLKRSGADVDLDTRMVRFDRALIDEYIRLAPSSFTLYARNPDRNLVFGGNSLNFAQVSSAPNCSDLNGGRRPGNWRDFCNLLKITHSLNILHCFGGYPVEPIDLPAPSRHLDCNYAFITLSDKAWHVYALGGGRIADGIEMVRIARGVTMEQLMREPSLHTVVNTNSPRRVDGPMADGVIEMARHGQAVIVTPFTLCGAMAPATVAGALAQQNAEALGVIAFAQMVRPGAPVMYGGFTSNVDMKSGAPAFGTPEYVRAALAGGQLARRYKLPYRSSNANASNAVDAQAAYESVMSVWGAVMGHANLLKHGAGWMEGGLVASYEKMIVDAEILQCMAEVLRPIVVDDDSLALDAVAEVAPGGHYFGAAHTLARYDTEFYAPMLSDWRNFEQWHEAGAATAVERANRIWKSILDRFEAPPIDPAIDEELKAYMARRNEEIIASAA